MMERRRRDIPYGSAKEPTNDQRYRLPQEGNASVTRCAVTLAFPMPDAWYGPLPLWDSVPGTGLRREFETIRRTVGRWQG